MDNVSNSPFRLFKSRIHEGEISAPLIVHWPNKIDEPRIESEPLHIMDIPATSIDGELINSSSLMEEPNLLKEKVFKIASDKWSREQPMYWEHEGNQGIRI